MSDPTHPALAEYLELHGDHVLLVEVRIRKTPGGFELRHVRDANLPAESLKKQALDQLRALALTTSASAFRPLRCAPTLRDGWLCEVRSLRELELALHHLYPGALADWWHARTHPSAAISYKTFTARQTGMYRITATLSEASLDLATRSQCAPRFCLKQRLWSAPGCEPEDAKAKSAIPCLEPCPMFMEFARVVARDEQADKTPTPLTEWEQQTIEAALLASGRKTDGEIRDADLSAPDNPRRVEFLLEKLRRMWKREQTSKQED